jgi:hypothetical protein
MLVMRGDYTPGKTVVVRFNTHKADGTPITLAGTPAISAYKNSTTQSTAGITLTVDYDSLTGLHHVAVDTSADGTFYAAANDFDLVITAGTVDSVSVVGTVVGSFSLSNRSALRPATADQTLNADSSGRVLLQPTQTGVTIPTVSVLTGHTPQTGDNFARIGANGANLTALATAAQINGLAINTRANLNVPVEIETPDTSTQVYKIRLHLFDVEGNMEAPDSTPTIALANAAGTDRSSRLSSASNPSTGVYTWDYTATAGDAEEQLVWVFTVVEGGATRTYPATSYVVEETAYRFSSSDRSTLNSVNTKLGTPAGASLAADVAAVKVDTAAILDDTGTAGVALATGSITAAKFAAGAVDAAALAADAAAEIAAAVRDVSNASPAANSLGAAVKKIKHAVFDDVTVSGDTLTLADGTTQAVTSGGRNTTEP